MTEVGINYDYQERELSVNQVPVTNGTSRTLLALELVYLGGWFGEVRTMELDAADPPLYGIPAGEAGYININSERLIHTSQVADSQTFTAGNKVYFDPQGASAAGALYDSMDSSDFIEVGIIIDAADDDSWIEFMPYAQRVPTGLLTGAVSDIVYTKEVAVTADATGGLAVTGIPIGARIIGASVICTAANASGTLTLSDGAGTPVAITDAITCAVDKAIDYAASIDDATYTVTADGLLVTAHGAADRGIMLISYKL